MSTNGQGSDGFPSSAQDSFSTNIPGFGSSPISQEVDAVTTSIDTSSLSAAAAEIAAFEPTWWPSDQMLLLLNWVNENSGMPCYAYTVGATTLAFRFILFPLFVSGQRNSSRMAHMQPELAKMKENIDKMGDKVDQETQLKMTQHTRALFTKYDCNPLKSIFAPLASAPVFMSMFFGLRTAPEIFPEMLTNGGMLWFPDLTAADPYMIMPLLSAATFLGMTEVGKEQMMANDPARGRVMVNAFRAMAIVMVPMTMNFNSAVFVYWTTNNSFSFLQAVVLKQPAVRSYFGIWDPPKPVPGNESKGIFEEIKKLTQGKKKEAPNATTDDRVKAHNEIIAQQKIVKKRLMERSGLSRK